MTEEDLELAGMIASNSGDIQHTMSALIDEVRRLRASLDEATSYPNLAMRTATDTWHEPSEQDEMNIVAFLHILANNARYIDAYKAVLFYGKPYTAPKPLEIDTAHFKYVGDHRRIHAVLGIVSEAGEIAENMLLEMQNLRHDLPIDQHKHDESIRDNYAEETGDMDWFQELLASSSGMISVRAAREQNIAKLQKRFPGKFTEEDAVARADKSSGRTCLD